MGTRLVKQKYIGTIIGTIDGHPVEVIDIYPHDIKVKCKNVVGLRSQIKNFLDDENKLKLHYFSGGDTKCQIKMGLLDDPKGVKIACLTSSLTELKHLVNESDEILNEHNALVCKSY